MLQLFIAQVPLHLHKIRLHHVRCIFAGPSLSVETHLKANFMSHVIIIAK